MTSTWIILTVVSLILSALFSGVEIAFVTADRVRTEIDVARGGLVSGIIRRFYKHAQFFISSILVGNNIVLVVYGMGAAELIEPWLRQYTSSEVLILVAQTLISTGVILLMGEFIPKSVFRINPNSSLKIFAVPIYIFYLLLYPISWFSTALSRGLMRLVGIKNTDTEIRTISVGELNDFLEENIDDLEEKNREVENEVKIFQNALDFSSTHLRDCMTPRNEVVAV
ncbi:MAG: CNNM domain-containing protein, partial [Muribaculaceae bacterium]|nr:CNNM domain-containing protein [Muribaculaceae bacterium]